MFRYRDANGIEKRLVNEAELLNAIADGRVHAGTPLRLAEDGEWMMAGRHPAFRRSGKRGLSRARGARPDVRGAMIDLARNPRARWAALVVMLLVGGAGFTASTLHERRLAEQRLAYASAMLAIAEGHTPAPELIAAPAPTAKDPALRTAWVRLQVARAIGRSIEATQSAHGIDGFHPPEAWISDAYMMNARAYPDIGDHWAGYLAWDREWSPGVTQLLSRLNTRFAEEAGLTERQTFELIDPAQPGLSAVGWDLELRREFAAEADRLHTTLVESRGNVFIDDGDWWFADTRTQRAYAEHVRQLRRIGALLEANAALRAAAHGVEASDGVLPAGFGGMRDAGGG